eukprot:434364-Pyramimonas_sp.AAC.1
MPATGNSHQPVHQASGQHPSEPPRRPIARRRRRPPRRPGGSHPAAARRPASRAGGRLASRAGRGPWASRRLWTRRTSRARGSGQAARVGPSSAPTQAAASSATTTQASGAAAPQGWRPSIDSGPEKLCDARRSGAKGAT